MLMLRESSEESLIFITQTSRPALPVARTPSSGPPSTIAPPNNETALMTQEDLMLAMATNVASLTSRTSMSVIVVGGVVMLFSIIVVACQQETGINVDAESYV